VVFYDFAFEKKMLGILSLGVGIFTLKQKTHFDIFLKKKRLL